MRSPTERSETWKSFDGTSLHLRVWTPTGAEPRGLLIAAHGLGEHSGRYAELANVAARAGFALACGDMRGHGKSGPRKGDWESLEALVLDLLLTLHHAPTLLGLGGRPLGLFGHSFGCVIAVHAAAVLDLAAPPLFLSSPCFGLVAQVPVWKQLAAKALPRLAPLVRVPLDIPPSVISNNPENNQRYADDPQILRSLTARAGRSFLGSLDRLRLQQVISMVRCPVQVLCGGNDRLARTAATLELAPLFAKQAAQTLEAGGHELFRELDSVRAGAEDCLSRWLSALGTGL